MYVDRKKWRVLSHGLEDVEGKPNETLEANISQSLITHRLSKMVGSLGTTNKFPRNWLNAFVEPSVRLYIARIINVYWFLGLVNWWNKAQCPIGVSHGSTIVENWEQRYCFFTDTFLQFKSKKISRKSYWSKFRLRL